MTFAFRRSWLNWSIALLAAVAFAAGCDDGADDTSAGGNGGGDGKKLVVGFAQVGEESSWRTAETKSIQDEATARGIELKFSEAQQKQENQIRALNAFIAQDVDAIILA